jgi:two-component system sensor histidine kinase UhpB
MDAVPIVPPLFQGTKNTTLHELQTGDRSRAADMQEGITNVLRHAHAGAMNIEATIEDHGISVEISDNGIGFPPDQPFGRGLTGMHERVRALSGSFEFKRENGRTYVRCRLPVGA